MAAEPKTIELCKRIDRPLVRRPAGRRLPAGAASRARIGVSFADQQARPRATADLTLRSAGAHRCAGSQVLHDEEFPDEADEDPVPEGPSKSSVKRELHALQALAERMTTLPRAELERLDLGESTWAALDETARIKDLRALRRHYKRIANCLARENTEPLQQLLAAREERARLAAAEHHALERWRARLIEEGDDALTEFLDAYPTADRQQLRQLVRAARADTDLGKPDAPRKLFRLLRTIVEGA
jgi:ribosome-associated protein